MKTGTAAVTCSRSKLAGEPGLLEVVAGHAGTERHHYTDAASRRTIASRIMREAGQGETDEQEFRRKALFGICDPPNSVARRQAVTVEAPSGLRAAANGRAKTAPASPAVVGNTSPTVGPPIPRAISRRGRDSNRAISSGRRCVHQLTLQGRPDRRRTPACRTSTRCARRSTRPDIALYSLPSISCISTAGTCSEPRSWRGNLHFGS